ncbi:glycosyltransferase family 2 protein [Caproicibacterium sp. NSD3]
MYRYSVGIVTYNSKNEIGRLLSQLTSFFSPEECQVVILDNCSTDGTAEWIEQHYPTVTVLRSKENKGFGHGHNQIIEKIDSQYHAIVNPDISVREDSIPKLCEYLDNHPEAVMVTPQILNEDGSEQFLPKRRPKIRYLLGGRLERLGGPFPKWRAEYTMKNEKLTEPTPIDFCTGCFSVIRTDILKKLGGFDDDFFMYFEDADLTRRAQKYGEVLFCPFTSVTHLWERASSKSFHFLKIQISSMLLYFKKWRNDPQRASLPSNKDS